MERMALTVFSIGHLVSIIAVEGVIYSPCDAFFSTMDGRRSLLQKNSMMSLALIWPDIGRTLGQEKSHAQYSIQSKQ